MNIPALTLRACCLECRHNLVVHPFVVRGSALENVCLFWVDGVRIGGAKPFRFLLCNGQEVICFIGEFWGVWLLVYY